ncbi:tripartite tricarboxylate transporter substrate binding protein [Ramlibacter sp. WS9]|uniref:Bug family tripartite tricarboxylate transporter substrate binding protein n=1 Tax=Ramlibacter sp. WS9 TaxID=1882741 RepID=UPI001143FCC7|nr:tripartite tricarboxylate transporter substrate binding protein [Ramlibacter sp. WS9]ROZ78849.1 tripartite tricarboxylate transporter substrate binding protein [Ramlibacter sp. WS9]
MMKRRQINRAILAAGCAAALPLRAQEPYPNKPVRVLVPSTAGGGIDLLARMFAQRLSEQMGQQFIVDNVGGAGGTIASGALARAAPDGYTLIFQATTAAVNAASLTKLPFDPVNALTPISMAAEFPLVMVVNPDVPAKDIKEFIALLRANPAKYSYGSAGVGTGTHLAAEWFKLMAKVHILHIPYKGTGSVMPDLISGQVHMLFDGVPPQSGHIKLGRVRPLAVTSKKRSNALPHVPTMAEVLPGYELPFWTGIFAPPNTPAPIVDKLAGEIRKATVSPQLATKLQEFGAEGHPMTPAEFASFWKQQVGLYRKIVKGANIKLEEG